MDEIIKTVISYSLEFGYRLAGSIVALIIGLWIIKLLTRGLSALMKARELDKSLQPFLRSLLNISLKALLVVSVLSMLGIEMTSFIAILGAAGLAIGMALSGTLQNFAGGVMILVFKPFQVGDVINTQGHTGSVFEIQIFNTILKTPDNKHIIIPNGGLSTGSLVNFSKEKTRRVDWTFGIGYGEDIDKARTILLNIIEEDSRINKDPEPFVAVSELADSSVNFSVRVWVDATNYGGVLFDMNEKVYKAFNKEGINIPFPQMDVHISKDI